MKPRLSKKLEALFLRIVISQEWKISFNVIFQVIILANILKLQKFNIMTYWNLYQYIFAPRLILL